MVIQAMTVEEVQAIVGDGKRILARGGGTKPALSTPLEGFQVLDVTGISGVVEYDPGEFTFTAQAGTRLEEVQRMLVEHGQYLPFDPLLAGRGATLGGSVAAGTSGSGRYHYGGIRDFILGVRFVDSAGQVVHAGGKVVKNAAGFDFPKLMVGSRGGLGVLVELSFKVFPRPEAYGTLRLDHASLDEALESLRRLMNTPLDLDALDLEPDVVGCIVWARLGGLASALSGRLERLCNLMERGEILLGTPEEHVWHRMRELEWVPENWSLVKVPLTPGRIPALEAALQRCLEDGLLERPVLRRYCCAGQVGWLALSEAPIKLDSLLAEQRLSGLALFGPPGRARLGLIANDVFAVRVKTALDPDRLFVEI